VNNTLESIFGPEIDNLFNDKPKVSPTAINVNQVETKIENEEKKEGLNTVFRKPTIAQKSKNSSFKFWIFIILCL
jgi:hypothetical protein